MGVPLPASNTQRSLSKTFLRFLTYFGGRSTDNVSVLITGNVSHTFNEFAIIFDCIHSNAVLVFKHIITSRVRYIISICCQTALRSIIYIYPSPPLTRFYQTKTEKKKNPHCVRSLLLKRNHIAFCITTKLNGLRTNLSINPF